MSICSVHAAHKVVVGDFATLKVYYKYFILHFLSSFALTDVPANVIAQEEIEMK